MQDNQKKLTVYILDDDTDVRASLSSIFLFNGFNVKTFESAAQLLNFPLQIDNSCFILDLCLPDGNGLELQRALITKGVIMPTVILSGRLTVNDAVEAMSAGAFTVLQKPVANKTLLQAVTTAIQNFGEKHHNLIKNQQAHAIVQQLSQREYQIAQLIADGLTSNDIANQLSLSPRTIEAYRITVFHKLGVRSAAPLAQLLLRASMHSR